MDWITNHQTVGLLKLVPPFWGLPRITLLLYSLLEEVDELEAAIRDVTDSRDVDTAELPRLVMLGKIVGELRRGRTVEVFRTAIKGRARANRSRGRISDLLDLWAILTDDSFAGREAYPAAFVIDDPNEPTFDVDTAARLSRLACAAGVSFVFMYGDGEFAFSDKDVVDPDAAKGWGDMNDPNAGAAFASAVQN